jgi:hypothetical protein
LSPSARPALGPLQDLDDRIARFDDERLALTPACIPSDGVSW